MYTEAVLSPAQDLDDAVLMHAFESLTLDPDHFTHPDHVRLAFAYLQKVGLLETLRLYREGLQRFTMHHGVPERYHETVTWALIILIHERLAAHPHPVDWSTFSAAHPDLVRWKEGVFFEYYPPDVLESPLARRTFVLPR
jgi:hypothetical protein